MSKTSSVDPGFPTHVFKRGESGSRLVSSQAELDALGPGWSNDLLVHQQNVADEIQAAHGGHAPEDLIPPAVRGASPAAEPKSRRKR
jgi:hypothetical protein